MPSVLAFAAAVATTATLSLALPSDDLPRSAADLVAAPYVHHHSLMPPLLSTPWPAAEHFWEFGGDTVMEDHKVRLTPDKQGRQGFLWNTVANELPAWEAHFGVHAFSKVHLGGDGLAFWYRSTHPRVGLKEGEYGPLLGAAQNFQGIGVLFDTYDNDNKHDNPKVVVVYNEEAQSGEFDPSRDFETDLQDSDAVRVASCQFDFRNKVAEGETTVRVRYTPDRTLEVYLQHSGTLSRCAIFDNIKLPAGYHFGFSGATGGVADKHDVTFFHLAPMGDGDATTYDEHMYSKEHESEQKEYWVHKPEAPAAPATPEFTKPKLGSLHPQAERHVPEHHVPEHHVPEHHAPEHHAPEHHAGHHERYHAEHHQEGHRP